MATSRRRGDNSLVVQADMPEVIRQRHIGAAVMVDADEGGVGDDVEALLAAIIGMGAPADVGQQAGRMAQALLVCRLVDAGRRP